MPPAGIPPAFTLVLAFMIFSLWLVVDSRFVRLSRGGRRGLLQVKRSPRACLARNSRKIQDSAVLSATRFQRMGCDSAAELVQREQSHPRLERRPQAISDLLGENRPAGGAKKQNHQARGGDAPASTVRLHRTNCPRERRSHNQKSPLQSRSQRCRTFCTG